MTTATTTTESGSPFAATQELAWSAANLTRAIRRLIEHSDEWPSRDRAAALELVVALDEKVNDLDDALDDLHAWLQGGVQ